METVKFSDVVTRANTKEDRFNTDKIYYVGGEHIDSNEMKIEKRGIIAGSTIGPMFYCGFKSGDILFVTRNPHLRKCGVVDFDGICSEKTFVLETKNKEVLLQEYLAIVMQSDDFWNYCEENKSGGVNYFLNWSTLAEYEFPLPSLSEQKVLAEKLWAAYEVKQSYLKMIEATEEMAKSQFVEMFGDPVSWQTDTSLPTLNDTVNVISGFPFDSEKFNTEGVGTPLIRIRDIQRGYSETFTTEAFDEQYKIKKYELLVGMDGMFDIARWQSDEAALNQRVCCLRMKGSENDTFIQYLVQPILKHIENGTNATTVKHISTKQINGIRVPIASHEQKNKFAMIAEQADKSISELRKSVDAIDKVIKSLINENL